MDPPVSVTQKYHEVPPQYKSFLTSASASRRRAPNIRPHVDALLPGHGRRSAGQCPKRGWGEIIS